MWKKRMKETLIVLLMFVLLNNFIAAGTAVADYDDFVGDNSITTDSVTGSDIERLTNEGKSKEKNDEPKTRSLEFDIMGPIFATLANILGIVANLFPITIQFLMEVVTGEKEAFTVERAVFNEVAIFNIDYFDIDDTYTIGNIHKKQNTQPNNVSESLKKNVAKFFIVTRLIAIAASLLTLIYVGIRMAFATVGAEKSKYKEMLMYWVESMLLIFCLQYIIVLLIGVGNVFENLAFDLRYAIDQTGESFERITMDTIYVDMLANTGWAYVLYSIVFWFLVGIQIKFFFFYMRRVITVGFLICIAPLVTITYPIDKVGDGKAQAFTVWLTELAINIFIQPIHAFIYLIFMYTAGEIAKKSILFALMFLLVMTRVEKMVLQLFNLKNVVSLKPVEDEKNKI